MDEYGEPRPDLQLAATGAMQLGLIFFVTATLLLGVGYEWDSWFTIPALVVGYAALGVATLLLLYMLLLDYRAMKQRRADRNG